jgi:hypothetical protein
VTIGFLDNDVILKLTICGLLYEALDCLEIEITDIRVLSSARYVLNGAKMRKKYPEEALDSAIKFVEKCSTLEPKFTDDYQLLNKSDGIDVGEAALIAAAIQEPAFLLVTGDKRCLRSLAAIAELDSIHKTLQGHVICLEQIIYKLIETQNFESIRARILLVRNYDTALKSAFGSGDKSEYQNVREALKSYIEDLQKDSNDVLVITI